MLYLRQLRQPFLQPWNLPSIEIGLADHSIVIMTILIRLQYNIWKAADSYISKKKRQLN